MSQLPSEIKSRINYELARATRIHRSAASPDLPLWIKREDELSSGISGSKLRKYASLLPYLKKKRIRKVGIIGGPNSNNLVGLAQLLKENGIKPLAFIREAGDRSLRGNSLFLDMLLEENERVWVSRKDWECVEDIASKALLESDGETLLLKEGCSGFEGLIGALTLAEDIHRNEEENELKFHRVYIDCGTGLSAMGLILGLELLDQTKPADREIVVTLIAETEAGVRGQLDSFRNELLQTYDLELNATVQVRFRAPTISPKFGSVNQSLFEACRQIARSEGLLLDPTYSVKHYKTAIADLEDNPPAGPSLFVYNGSSLGLCGFQDKLATKS
ncbi:pyridoxal-phosphate dependent enzyme [Pelagicoccus albus]|uniref:Pyridoxal-phosphate dependent enzyme n=1 Tax=Pelagicoccus albus TaxID=415222 RepID=A0A7X1E9E9_9BACT|nr:pyridoxal-phosphate dependent enzyme [Pelagicoccus albus]MBC2605722.1 pyridoxal-phosphate dependent enzyme [Pelagicoccus albus]